MMIKNIYHHFGSGSTPESSEIKYYENGTINWLNTADLKNDLVVETSRKITSLALKEKSLRIYPINTLAIAMYGQGDTRGNVGLLKIEATTNQAACMMYCSSNSIPEYMLLWFVAKKTDIRELNVGATQPNMNKDFVRNLLMSLPPLPEQKSIAHYLDTKTAQIDRKIDLLTQKAKSYADLKRSLINETVTRGRDRSVPMKDSAIEWIGEVPEHWEVKRVKEFSVIVNGSTPKSTVLENWDGNHNWVTTDDLGKLTTKFVTESKRKITDIGLRSCGTSLCPKGSVVLSGRAPIGHIGIFSIEACTNQGCKTLVFDQKIANNTFVFYGLFVSKEKLQALGRGTTFIELSTKELSLFRLSLPPLSEQKAIATYLDTKTAQIDQIIQTINTQIEKLKELRKTLINDVVTGKIKVTED